VLRIRILDPGWVKKSRSGSYFRELIKIFGVKILKFFDADVDPDPGIQESF
jgi:hypothetical protein